MIDFKPRPGTFLPLMEAEQRRKTLGQTESASPITLLEILARQSQRSLPLFDLQTLGGMQPSSYGKSLKSLRDAGYIAIDGDAPEQLVHLTDSGAGVVRLARPA